MQRRRLLRVGSAVLGGLATAVVPRTQQVSRAQQAEDAGLLRELAERLLSPPFPRANGEAPRARLLPGVLPPELPVEVPLPPGSRLIGSVTREQPPPPRGEQIDIVLDVPGTEAEVFAWYGQALAERGWSAPPVGGPAPGGFVPPSLGTSGSFCQGPNRPWLSVTVLPSLTGLSDVRVGMMTSRFSPCDGLPGTPLPRGGRGDELLPRLVPPPGVHFESMGGSSGGWAGGQRSTSDALVVTDMDVGDLEAHFAQQ